MKMNAKWEERLEAMVNPKIIDEKVIIYFIGKGDRAEEGRRREEEGGIGFGGGILSRACMV
jgi:hypothetical protein